jgi:hypothetical protein
MTRRPLSSRWTAVLAAAALLAAADPALAQAGGDGFTFRAPRVGVTLRAGLANPTARGDLFDFATDTLTLGRGDFAGVALAADLSLGRPGSRVDWVLGLGYASASAPSEFRNMIGTDDLPIAQTTSFHRVPLTLGARAYLAPRGRAIGRFAWVPARVAPYVGAGVGATWYRFRQEGEFVDYATQDIFFDTFETSGWGPTGYGGAGVDLSLSPLMALTADARYVWARARVGGDFDGFDRIDLSGLSTTLGITFRF